MAERIADNADLAVDELKRRARRRLVGAVVLALAAAVILPMLLEKDPKPLGDDVSVQIPPIDEGRFVNRLTGRAGDSKSAPKSDPKALSKAGAPKQDAAPATIPAPITVTPAAPVADSASSPVPAPTSVAAQKKSVAEAEQRVLSPGSKSTAKADVKAAPEAKVDTPMPAPVVATALPPKSEPMAPVAAAPAKGESFAVQIAAFTDDKGANSLAGKLKKAGYASTYTEPVETSRGTLWRVRVGGYATRQEAEAARAKLKAEGWNGLVVAAK
ncbi:MAG: SPOR domain-containing protein [Casimicrobiaceae bacterium]